ncbi:MAG: hypothetical protein SU899_02655 [Chloroflexota bacterium]|nr:hypothetical protein [Chloroflexota bacterium]
MKKGLITCVECEEYPCERYARRDWGTDQLSRTAEKSLSNIEESGMEDWLKEQKRRQLLLESLLIDYNEGRSMSFYCLAAMLMSPELIEKAMGELKERIVDGQINSSNVKGKAKALKEIIQDLAQEHDIELKLKKL